MLIFRVKSEFTAALYAKIFQIVRTDIKKINPADFQASAKCRARVLIPLGDSLHSGIVIEHS